VTVTADPASAGPVLAERGALTRVVVNLLVNAYRYGGPTIAITVRTAGGQVQLAVEDDGPGVPAEFESRMFDPLTRGSDGQAHPRGSGLGLAISREIVESVGGHLDFDPIRPHGARLTVTLPTGPNPPTPSSG
jgi:signal transduction histidine kinase